MFDSMMTLILVFFIGIAGMSLTVEAVPVGPLLLAFSVMGIFATVVVWTSPR